MSAESPVRHMFMCSWFWMREEWLSLDQVCHTAVSKDELKRKCCSWICRERSRAFLANQELFRWQTVNASEKAGPVSMWPHFRRGCWECSCRCEYPTIPRPTLSSSSSDQPSYGWPGNLDTVKRPCFCLKTFHQTIPEMPMSGQDCSQMAKSHQGLFCVYNWTMASTAFKLAAAACLKRLWGLLRTQRLVFRCGRWRPVYTPKTNWHSSQIEQRNCHCEFVDQFETNSNSCRPVYIHLGLSVHVHNEWFAVLVTCWRWPIKLWKGNMQIEGTDLDSSGLVLVASAVGVWGQGRIQD